MTKKKVLMTLMLLALGNDTLMAQEPSSAVDPEQAETNSVPENDWRLSDEQKDHYLRAMQEHSLEMHDLSNRILAEQDPEKREALKERQFQLMKDYRVRLMGRLQQLREQSQ